MEKNIGRSRESRNYNTGVSRSYEDTEVKTYTMERRKSLFTMCEKYKPDIHPPSSRPLGRSTHSSFWEGEDRRWGQQQGHWSQGQRECCVTSLVPQSILGSVMFRCPVVLIPPERLCGFPSIPKWPSEQQA